ncbi:hypothetical protein [Uliginosibacterium gangwonense]|uniref:hypothetical protein n=1 Tax=Uliginosibacterium gangwonense TaxID=392736 RepID=UPI000361911E|nr:hypothetical protein [Uliginosibacterium gangwonense]
MPDYESLIDYLIANIDKLTHSSGAGLLFDFPDFELMPFDYLEFAEQDLSKDTTSSRIGCVSNLKRATECEMDTLIHILGLTKHVKSFPKKLEFVSNVGLISPRSLDKLNRIRNKMEHEYAVPKLSELEAYFDLASGFVYSIEGYIFMLASHAEQEWCRSDPFEKPAFRVKLERDPARIEFCLISSVDKVQTLTFDTTNFDNYLKVLKVFFLLCRATALLSTDYLLSKLTGTPLTINGRG